MDPSFPLAFPLAFPAISFADVVAAVPDASRRGDTEVSDVALDSRTVGPGALFFCVPGAVTDGHDFAASAIEAGASALVVERWLDLDVPQALVPSVRSAMGPMSAVAFGDPARAMTMLGITGTNGKTTTTYLMEAILRAGGLRSGVIGTNGARVDGEPVPLARTTPEAPDLHRLLARMRDAGVRGVAMEVSSHALAQERVGGVVFDAVAFTNLSRDHLDYHSSMEDYFEAKAALFTPEHAHVGAVNVDDPFGRRLAEAPTIPLSSFAIDREADLRATEVVATTDGLSFRIGERRLTSNLRGRFNVSNCLAAIALARRIGMDDGVSAAGIEAVREVPGRVEPIDAGQGFLVVVDYAHTPDSIHTVLQAARPLTSGRLFIVFGCGGDRDRDKRPLMGRAATAGADLTVLTSDNPRSEDPMSIIAQIEAGAVQGGGDYVVEPDRRLAIRLALGQARPGDMVVIAGKGHEPYQVIGDTIEGFDDRQVAREELLALGGRS
ncbi:MAG TPA: UDP-N-acetylmuramoyl-L-alanyl-D-glutamate--2,6-diaminopimelate ligase [Actinomycetota bacterium]